MPGHVCADHGRIILAARIEAACVIAHAGLGLFRLGVSKQHQAHVTNIDDSSVVLDLKFLYELAAISVGASNPPHLIQFSI